MTARSAAAIVAALLLGCGPGAEPGGSTTATERPVESITHFGPQTELFVEFPALVVGHDSPFAAHVTTLNDFKPLAAGRVSVLLIGPNDATERFDASAPTVPGIFRPVAKPTSAGNRELVVEVATAGGTDRHEVGQVHVAADLGDVATAEQADQGIACGRGGCRGAWLAASAGAVHLSGGDARQADARSLRAPDRAVAIPDRGGRAGEERARGDDFQEKHHRPNLSLNLRRDT